MTANSTKSSVTLAAPPASLVTSRQERLRKALGHAPFDAFLAVAPANVDYATGYRSMSGSVHARATCAALVTSQRTMLAGAVADSAPALAGCVADDDFVGYGRFYYESVGGAAAPTRMVDTHDSLVSAILTVVAELGLEAATIGVDETAMDPRDRARLERELGNAHFVDASAWAIGVRSRKLPDEVELLRRSAVLVDDGISAAIDEARPGTTEQQLAATISGVMVAGGCQPRFVVVTSGPRSALSDCFATDRPLAIGDIVRFDVGGILDGYWSDLGRTAVVGPPSALQRSRYDALLEGEQAELDLARPGVLAQDVFDIAVRTVEAGGLAPYRRHHCGHGIGLDVYEAPIVSRGVAVPLEEGMTFCFETPYYELGWGGMMVEDTLVVTADGCTLLNTSDRSLRVIEG